MTTISLRISWQKRLPNNAYWPQQVTLYDARHRCFYDYASVAATSKMIWNKHWNLLRYVGAMRYSLSVCPIGTLLLPLYI